MKIFIDFDDVIFNTKRFKKDLIRIFLKNGITKTEFENSYYTFQKRAQEFGQYYDPKKQIMVLKKKNKIDVDKLNRALDDFMADLKKYVFPDVMEFLNIFPKKNLFLITYGHVRFQFKKIRGAGIKDNFSRIVITKDDKVNKIIELAKRLKFGREEQIVLIDDRPEQLESAKRKKRGILTFRLCRPQGRYSDLICLEKDYEATSLKKVFKIMKKEGHLEDAYGY